MTHPLSIRLPDLTIERLSIRARVAAIAPRTLAQRYVEEGIRTDEHPLVRFIDGPAGRRPSMIGSGLDVAEVIETLRENETDVHATAEYLTIPVALVDAAIAYYGAYTSEIDDWNARGRDEAARAEAQYRAGFASLSP